MLDDDIIGVVHRLGPGRYVRWGDATAEERTRYLSTGSIWPQHE
jgi:hypothetical protein